MNIEETTKETAEEIVGIKGNWDDDSSHFFIRHFMGRANCEAIKAKYPIRQAKEDEHILTFGIFKGYTLEQINEIDHMYIVFLSTFDLNDHKLKNRPDIIRLSLIARQMVTQKERLERIGKIEFMFFQCQRANWLLAFIKDHAWKGEYDGSERDKRFLRSIRFQILQQMRIELLTKKQLTVISDIWARYYSKVESGDKFNKERERFKDKMRPYWKRKYDSIDDI